jgi:hypothetical protein
MNTSAILGMRPITEQHPVPGTIQVTQYQAGPIKNGKIAFKPVVAYERTDRVSVRTGSEANLTGKSYVVALGLG